MYNKMIPANNNDNKVYDNMNILMICNATMKET